MPATTNTLSVAQLLVLTTAARRRDRMVLPLPAGLRAHGAVQRKLLASLLKLGLAEELPTEDPALSWRRDGQGRCNALRITAVGLEAIEGIRAAEAERDGTAPPPAPPAPRLGTEAAQPAPGAPAAPANRRHAPRPPEETGALGTGEARPAAGHPVAPDALAGVVPVPTTGLAAAASVAGAAVRPGGKLGRVLDAAAAEGGATLAELVALTGWQPHTARAAVTRLRQRGFTLRLTDAGGGRKAYRMGRPVPA